MRLKYYRQIDNRWTYFDEKVTLKIYIRHLIYSIITIYNYYKNKYIKLGDE